MKLTNPLQFYPLIQFGHIFYTSVLVGNNKSVAFFVRVALEPRKHWIYGLLTAWIDLWGLWARLGLLDKVDGIGWPLRRQ